MKNDTLTSLLQNIEQQKKLLIKLESDLKRAQGHRSFLEVETIPYQLGAILLDSRKSLKNFLATPSKLLALHKYSKERRRRREEERRRQVVSTKQVSDSRVAPVGKGFSKGLTLLDPISDMCWRDAFVGFPLVREKFASQIESSSADFAFFESAWRANKGTWLYAFTSPGLKHDNAQALLKAIELLQKKNIPIVFWNKEDPMHYEMFKPIASRADYVFTTDELLLPRYKKELAHERVWALPFAAPVKKTNPIGRFALSTESVCFAGTYYAKNHEGRKRQMDFLLKALLDNNGVIYNRASNEKSGDYDYPEIFQGCIRPAVEFSEMIGVYKKFKVFLNVNTITNSTTMMSRRVYELLASGTPVVSTPSKAIVEQFPGIVITVANEEEANLAVKKLLNSSYHWHKHSVRGIRQVMSFHTYEQRWRDINNAIHQSGEPSMKTGVRIIAQYHGYLDLEVYLQTLLTQNHVDVMEVVLVHSASLQLDQNVLSKFNVNTVKLSDFKPGNYLDKNSKIDFTFFTDDRTLQYKNSLWGMISSFAYADGAAVCRSMYYKSSKVGDGLGYDIDSPNWYVWMGEVPSACCLVRDSKSEELLINLVNKKIKSKNEKSIFMIDPFNSIFVDEPEGFSDVAKLKNFLYKTSSYLGV